MELPDRFRQVRKALGLSQGSLAHFLKCTPGYVSQIEAGQKIPSPRFMTEFEKLETEAEAPPWQRLVREVSDYLNSRNDKDLQKAFAEIVDLLGRYLLISIEAGVKRKAKLLDEYQSIPTQDWTRKAEAFHALRATAELVFETALQLEALKGADYLPIELRDGIDFRPVLDLIPSFEQLMNSVGAPEQARLTDQKLGSFPLAILRYIYAPEESLTTSKSSPPRRRRVGKRSRKP